MEEENKSHSKEVFKFGRWEGDPDNDIPLREPHLVDVERCLEAEAHLRTMAELIDYQVLWDLSKIRDQLGFFEDVRTECRELVERDPKGAIAEHLYLAPLTRRILTRAEFEEAFNQHPNMNPQWKERLWYHMVHCPVLLMLTYRELLDTITATKEYETEPTTVVKLAKWISYLIQVFDQARHNFSFCLGCACNNPLQCQFWGKVSVDLNHLIHEYNIDMAPTQVKEYLTQLEIPCKCYRSIAELQKS